MTRSYSHGASSVALIGETIGENLERTVARWGERDALVVPFQGVRLTYRAFDDEVDRVARGLLAGGLAKGERIGIWSPNNAEWVLVQYATAKIGAILVNINPAYRTHEVGYVLQQSGCRMLVAATEFKGSSYVAMVDEVRGELPALERTIWLGTSDWDELLAAGDGTSDDELRGPDGRPRLRRGDQHPVHERHHRLPEGRHAQPPQHPEQRLVHRRGLRLHRGRPRLHPGALLPLLRHGAREPGGDHPRRGDGRAGARLRPRRHAAGRPGRALHEPLRRADHVHRRAEPPRLQDASTCRRSAPASWPARPARSR